MGTRKGGGAGRNDSSVIGASPHPLGLLLLLGGPGSSSGLVGRRRGLSRYRVASPVAERGGVVELRGSVFVGGALVAEVHVRSSNN